MRSLLTAALLALLLAACQVVVDDPGIAAPDFDEDPEVADPADGEDLAVPLEILDGPGGGTLAFVPVLGDIDLGARPVLTLDLAPEGEIGLQGLLGSDVLSGFGAVVVDYDAGTLTLRPRDASP